MRKLEIPLDSVGGGGISLKMIVLGDKFVGKTTLCNAFIEATQMTTDDGSGMMSSPRPTSLSQGINDMVLCELDTVEYGRVQIKLWDTVGEEYSAPTSNVYRGAHGIILMYDVTHRESFENIERRWMPRIRSLLGDGGTADDRDTDERDLLMREHIFKLLVVANKIDLTDRRQVTEQEARDLTHRLRVPYVQLSSLDRHTDIVGLPFILLTRLLAPLFTVGGGASSARRISVGCDLTASRSSLSPRSSVSSTVCC